MILCLSCIGGLVVVQSYKKFIEKKKRKPGLIESLRRPLCDVRLRFSTWNITQVVSHYALCSVYTPNTLYSHARVFSLGFMWFVFEQGIFMLLQIPRHYDNLIFYAFGHVMYIVTTCVRKMNRWCD